MSTISEERWRALLELSFRFRNLAPWEWMYDSDLFGVRNRNTGEVGYCCILGRSGQAPGLAVYKGLEGLHSFEKMQQSDLDTPFPLQVVEQNCLMLEFGSRKRLDRREAARLSQLGFQVRGSTRWPVFRDYSPGFAPSEITTDEEALWLQDALEQGLEIAARIRSNPDLLQRGQDDNRFVLVRQLSGRDSGVWTDEWTEAPVYEPAKPPVEVNKLFLRSNSNGLSIRFDSVWVTDTFMLPTPIQAPGRRAELPRLLLILDGASGMVIFHQVFRPGVMEQELQQRFMRFAQTAGYLPERIVAPRVEVLGWWEDITKILGIRLELNRQVRIVDEFVESLFRSMSV
ncbi:MAG: hypothetical protein NW241_16055 [Bacteroidia bacterium]|nr:hypothetical protein [Bacteroidia bacterium]